MLLSHTVVTLAQTELVRAREHVRRALYRRPLGQHRKGIMGTLGQRSTVRWSGYAPARQRLQPL